MYPRLPPDAAERRRAFLEPAEGDPVGRVGRAVDAKHRLEHEGGRVDAMGRHHRALFAPPVAAGEADEAIAARICEADLTGLAVQRPFLGIEALVERPDQAALRVAIERVADAGVGQIIRPAGVQIGAAALDLAAAAVVDQVALAGHIRARLRLAADSVLCADVALLAVVDRHAAIRPFGRERRAAPQRQQ